MGIPYRRAVTMWIYAVTAAIALLAMIACGQHRVGSRPDDNRPPVAGSTARSGMPYLPDRLLDAPGQPPELALVTAGGRAHPLRIAVDWSPRGGSLVYPPERITWPGVDIDAAEPRVEFEFDTAQVPSRVVIYRYAQIGADGVPEEGSGTETVCSFADPAAVCWRSGDGTVPARVVVSWQSGAGAYWVVHAAWPVLIGRTSPDDVDVTSASWVIRIGVR